MVSIDKTAQTEFTDKVTRPNVPSDKIQVSSNKRSYQMVQLVSLICIILHIIINSHLDLHLGLFSAEDPNKK